MSRTGRIRRFFGDAEYEFRIRIGEAEELQEAFDCGLMQCMDRVAGLQVGVIKAVLRVGLVGGGMKKEKAARFVDLHLQDGYFLEHGQLAADVLEAAIKGNPDDPVPAGEPGEGEGPKASGPYQTDASDMAFSTETDSPQA